MSYTSTVLHLVSIGLIVYTLLKIMELEKNLNEEESYEPHDPPRSTNNEKYIKPIPVYGSEPVHLEERVTPYEEENTEKNRIYLPEDENDDDKNSVDKEKTINNDLIDDEENANESEDD